MTSAKPTRVVLGNEYDKKLRNMLLDTLKDFGAQATDRWYGIGGSQEVQCFEVEVEGETIEVESETYVGLSVFGNEGVVNRIATRVRERMSA